MPSTLHCKGKVILNGMMIIILARTKTWHWKMEHIKVIKKALNKTSRDGHLISDWVNGTYLAAGEAGSECQATKNSRSAARRDTRSALSICVLLVMVMTIMTIIVIMMLILILTIIMIMVMTRSQARSLAVNLCTKASRTKRMQERASECLRSFSFRSSMHAWGAWVEKKINKSVSNE